MLNVDPLV